MTSHFEPLGTDLNICVTPEHKFGTDAFLLSDFAAPRRKDTVCDLCSGCGIVGVLWFREPENAPLKVYAVEIQKQAVEQMYETLAKNSILDERFVPMQMDLRELAKKTSADISLAGKLDLVTCNPPYKSAGGGILSETDSDQIARHETMCLFSDICETSSRLLRFGGRLCVCQRPERLADAICAMRFAGIEPKRLRFVQSRLGAEPWLFLLDGTRGGKPFMRVDAPLIVQSADGFSDEMLKIYRKKRRISLPHDTTIF